MERKKGIRDAARQAAGIVCVAVFGLLLFGGCNEEADSPAGSGLLAASTAATLSAAGEGIDLTREEIDSALDLTEEQAAALAPVLEKWSAAEAERRAAMESRRSTRGDRRGDRGHEKGTRGRRGGPPEPPGGDPPLLVLLEGSREVLSGEQYVGLIELLAQKREARRPERKATREERAGERSKGDRFGRGFPGLDERAADELDLTEEQRTALEALRESTRERMRTLFPAAGGREENREAMRVIREEARAALEEILTEEQSARLEELRGERREEHRERDEERGAERIERHAEWIARALGLDDGQRAGVEAILEDAREIVRALLDGAGDEADQDTLHAQMRAIRDESAAAIRALLNEEQAAAFDALDDLLPGQGGPGGHHGPPHR